MDRRHLLFVGAGLALAGCDVAVPGTSATPAGAYVIRPGQAERVEQRFLDELNLRRGFEGLTPLAYDPALMQAASLHALDMSGQNRPWHWGSDASSPVDRVRRAGYPGRFLGQLISESFETETMTLEAWLADPTTRPVVLDPEARDLGFGWHQEPSGKLWWTMVTATTELPAGPVAAPAAF